MALIESKAKNDPKGTFRRLLVDVLREQRDYAKAEQVLRDLVKEAKDDVNLSAALVQVVSLQAAEAAAAGKIELQRSLDEKALTMIREERKRHPSSLVFLQAECDLAARAGRLQPGPGDHRGDRQALAGIDDGPASPCPPLRPAGQDQRGGQGLQRSPGTEPPPARYPRPARPGADQAGRYRRGGEAGEDRARRRTRTGSTPCSWKPGR